MPFAEKNDLNRIGLFSEMGYISVGDPYVNSNNSKFSPYQRTTFFIIYLNTWDSYSYL